MKKILSIVMIIVVAILSYSCDKYLDVNKHKDAPDENTVSPYLYLAGVEGAFQEYYYDLRSIMPVVQYMGTNGSGSTLGTSHTYIAGSDYSGQVWRMTYWTQGKNLENIITKAKELEQWKLAGIGLAIKANSWDILTKEYGEAPMKQAYEPGRLNFEYDYQPEIFQQVRDWAYEAIQLLETPDNNEVVYRTTVDEYDVIYGGDVEKWKKFAYGVIVRNLSALSRKSDFISGGYADELIQAAQKALATSDDDATVYVPGGGKDVPSSGYNNFFGVNRDYLTNSYWQHDYITTLMTGTVVEYANGQTERTENSAETGKKYRYKIADKQYITDTSKSLGHYDPRAAVKLATTDDSKYEYIDDRDSVMSRYYIGGRFSGRTGFNTGSDIKNTSAPNVFHLLEVVNENNAGSGRWIFRDEAPYILMTASEIQFCLAEAYWMKGDKTNALEAFKKAISLDMDFTEKYIFPGGPGKIGGDKISKTLFRKLANEYLAGPYVGGLTTSDLTLSHIMMQKYVALYPWGALETWVDQRKFWYEIDFTGDYPENGNGWSNTRVKTKFDDNPTKVYKGYYFVSSEVDTRGNSLHTRNNGAPAFRIRPRYNSEYMWNRNTLDLLKPISGLDDKYNCSPMWFQYPGDMPQSLNY